VTCSTQQVNFFSASLRLTLRCKREDKDDMKKKRRCCTTLRGHVPWPAPSQRHCARAVVRVAAVGLNWAPDSGDDEESERSGL
jgi:hypothetical protein